MNNKKILLTSFVVLTFGMFAVFSKQVTTTTPQSVVPNTDNTDTASTNPTVTPTPNSTYKDGIYTGKITDATYGNVQVKVTIAQGKISNVQFLDYPQDRHTSLEISNRSMPLLSSEAIQAQKADVDIVSGATQTSQAFIESLRSALVQAQG